MHFTSPLLRWDFDRREKRFFIYGKQDGQVAHCPNTGSLRGILDRCQGVWVRDHGEDCGRKLRYTAELCELENGVMVGINTQRGNALAAEALRAGLVEELGAVTELQIEAKWDAATRFDLRFLGPDGSDWWGEVKNTTLAEGVVGMFPDAVTARGTKHMGILAGIARTGGKALQVYVVTRADVSEFRPAAQIDAVYAATFHEAQSAGVTFAALGCRVTPGEIIIDRRLPIVL